VPFYRERWAKAGINIPPRVLCERVFHADFRKDIP
jgi:hypothetical protein